jgi:mRNA interferase MazF
MKRGDVILIDFPFSDRTGSKLRPSLVVQEDAFNQTRDDTVVAAISRTQRFAETEVLIDVATPEGKQSKLHHNSVVDCALVVTIDQKLVHVTLGSLPDSLMLKLSEKLKTVLGIV